MTHLPFILNELTIWLRQNRPEVTDLLQTGLSDFEIDAITHDLPFPLSQEVYELYRWRNGFDLLRSQSIYSDSLIFDNELLFLPLSDSVSTYRGFINSGEYLSLFPVFKYDTLCDYLSVSLAGSNIYSIYYVYGTEPLEPKLIYPDLVTTVLSLSASSGMLEFQIRDDLILARYSN